MFLRRALFFAVGSIYSLNSIAGSFQLWEQDASGIGDYHAGAAAEAKSAGTQFYNPAGMVNLDRLELSAGVAYIPLQISYTGQVGSVAPVSTVAQSNTNNWVPDFYIVYPFLNRYAFGFGVTVPFGASTDYPIDNPIADAATMTELQTVNLNPSFAVALTKYASIAAGFDALYGKANYDSAFFQFFPNSPIPLTNQLTSWGYGWNGGLLFFLTPHTRIGASYRSSIKLNGQGQSAFVDSTPLTNETFTGGIQLPATTILSFYSDLNQRLALLFSAFYTSWSVFQQLELNNVMVLGTPMPVTMLENYQNSWNFALGMHYWLLENFLMLKVGAGYDETPTQNGFRDVRLPDAPKYALAIGLHMETIHDALEVDVGWIHFFVLNALVNNSQSLDDNIALLAQVNGTAKIQADVIGAQIAWKI